MQTIFVNLFEFDPPRNGGISRLAYVLSHLLMEKQRQGRARVVFGIQAQTAHLFADWAGLPDALVLPLLLDEGHVPPVLKALRPDIIISPMFGMNPLLTAIPEIAAAPHIAVMPDTLALDKPALLAPPDVSRRRQIYQNLRSAQVVVTISQDARERLIRHLDLDPARVRLIPLAGDLPSFQGAVALAPSGEREIPRPYVFYPANGWRHKRHDLLLRVMNEVWRERPEVRLVLSGWREPDYIRQLCAQFHCPEDHLIDLGYLPDYSQVQALYRNAEALLFTSQYEGFGMPLVEAMRNDCPILCAPLTSIPEVAGQAALYVNSKLPHDWADAFLNQLPARRQELIERGRLQAQRFTWEESTRAWETLLEGRGLFDPSGVSRSDPALWAGLPALGPELHAWRQAYQAEQQAHVQTRKQLLFIQNFLQHPYRDYLLNRSLFFQKVAARYERTLVLRKKIQSGLHALFTSRLSRFSQYPPRPLLVPAQYFQPLALSASSQARISIVTPSFNQGMFLEKTITSVLEQNYPALEYIIQDGGSRDDSLDILEEYRPRLHHLEIGPDQGQAHAINLGFAHTSGEIMAYLNSDDFLLPGALNYVAAYFQAHPAVEVLYGHRLIVDENDQEIGRWLLPPHQDAALLWYDYVPQETLFWRRSLWEKIGGRIDDSFQFALDWDLLLRFRLAGARFARVNRFLACFRAHGAQKTALNLPDTGQREIEQVLQRLHGRWPSLRERDRQTALYRWQSVGYYAWYRFTRRNQTLVA